MSVRKGDSRELRVHMPIFLLSVGLTDVPAAANTNSQADCHAPPTMRGMRRPNWMGPELTEIVEKCPNESHLLHDIHPSKRAAKVHSAQDDLCDIRVADPDRLENRRAVL